MKLINKFTIWYMSITTLVIVVGGLIIFKSIEHEIDKEEAFDLRDWIENTAGRLKKGHSPRRLARPPVEIRELDYDAPIRPFTTTDTVAMHEQLQQMERQLKGSASYKIRGKHYYISVYNTVVESDDIVEALVKSFTWIFLLVLGVVVITNRVVSKKLLQPFYQTLQAMKSFSLKQKEPLSFKPTGTTEFSELNRFLENMTKKALGDYRSLKEFSENASHEMQTPLAVIRGKLELLLESELNDEQAGHINSALSAIDKLAKMGKSLALLSKLENREFDVTGTINLSEALNRTLNDLDELITMRSLTLTTNIQQDINITLHPDLLPILLNNLLSNAIRHNIDNGTIDVRLTDKELTISNTGKAPDTDTEELFNRFRKGNQSSESSGLGLSIVRQICEISNFDVRYTFGNGTHVLKVVFVP